MRLVTDMIEFCSERMPRWHPVSISGYHIREAGSTAQQELAFTLKDGFTYVEQAIERGLDVDDVRAAAVVLLQRAHRLLRGDRQVPRRAADLGARAARHLRRARRALAADALPHPDGGRVAHRPAAAQQHRAHRDRGARRRCSAAPSRCTPTSYDEALALPTEEAVRVALRTQQIIAHETGVTNTIDPLGGSYFVEALTDRMEEAAYDYFRKIDELGGMVEAIKQNYPQREIADASFQLPGGGRRGERIIVGVNRYQADDDRRHRDPADRRGARAQADRPRPGGRAPRATPPRWRAPRRAARGGRRGDRT